MCGGNKGEVMTNITIAADDDILMKVRRLAVERHTTITAMVRDILERLAAREDSRTEEVVAQLQESFDASDVVVGDLTWQREDLHAR